MNFKLGTRIPPRLYGQGMEHVAQWAAQSGIEVLDVAELTPEVRDICDAGGIEIGTVDAPWQSRLLSRDDARRAGALASAKEQITRMAALGGRKVFLCLFAEDPEMNRRDAFAVWKESFAELVPHAEREDVYLAVEGWPGPGPQYNALGCTPETLRAMFAAVPSGHLGINYDPSHLVRLGIDYLRFLREFGDRVIHCHGKDTQLLPEERYEYGHLPPTFGSKYAFSEGAWRYTIPGHGEVDWKSIAIELDRIGYRGAVCIELEDHRYWGSLEAEQQGIVKALAHLSLFFK